MIGVIGLTGTNPSDQWMETERAITSERAISYAPLNIESFETGEDLSTALRDTAMALETDRIVLIDANIPLNAESLLAILKNEKTTIEQSSACHLPLYTKRGEIDFPNFGAGTIVNAISAQTLWPTLLTSISRDAIEGIETIEIPKSGPRVPAVVLQVILKATVSGAFLTPLNASALIDESFADEVCALQSGGTAAILRFAISNWNIETLFPNHDWESFSEESAAASYHTLAAKFIRLGDTESARECLTLSDQLEDSPRSMALKALISVERGETLGAVANLVSSLQQYEVRKRNVNDSHYLTFKPKDLECVNSSLHNGLAALNKQQNEDALSHFAKAVFTFDNFYTENGIDHIVRS